MRPVQLSSCEKCDKAVAHSMDEQGEVLCRKCAGQ